MWGQPPELALSEVEGAVRRAQPDRSATAARVKNLL
jgi:hypothetical protein